jgi:predicted nucleic acid-binding protein
VFLLDTNVVSELIKRTPDPKLVTRVARENPSDLYISTISEFELRYGAARSAKPAAFWRRI